MKNTLAFAGVAIGGIVIILLFVTSKTYVQLAIASILYPIAVYITLKLIPRTENQENYNQVIAIPATPVNTEVPQSPNIEIPRSKVDIADIEKRTFLKLIGTAGISFFLFSLLGRRADDLIFGVETPKLGSQLNFPATTPQLSGQPSIVPNDEYRITEIEDGVISYYGFVNKKGEWMIMKEDSQQNSFRYSKGESGFSKNWAGRETLKYDYYHNLF